MALSIEEKKKKISFEIDNDEIDAKKFISFKKFIINSNDEMNTQKNDDEKMNLQKTDDEEKNLKQRSVSFFKITEL